MLNESSSMFPTSKDFYRSMTFLLKLPPEMLVSFANQNFPALNSMTER